jgi:hypothetical protein
MMEQHPPSNVAEILRGRILPLADTNLSIFQPFSASETIQRHRFFLHSFPYYMVQPRKDSETVCRMVLHKNALSTDVLSQDWPNANFPD